MLPAHERELTALLEQEVGQMFDECRLQIRFGVLILQIEEFVDVGIQIVSSVVSDAARSVVAS